MLIFKMNNVEFNRPMSPTEVMSYGKTRPDRAWFSRLDEMEKFRLAVWNSLLAIN